MRQRDTGTIAAAPEAVWPWIADPERVAEWNSKLEASSAPAGADLREGVSYGARYRLGRNTTQAQAVVEVCNPPHELAIRYRVGPEAWALERTTLETAATGTRLTRVVEIQDRRIPWPVRLLAGLLMRFGRPAPEGRDESGGGGTHVDAIRRLCEGS